MAKKKQDPAVVEQRKQERVAFVQGHPLLQPEQARQQFYVQTRAQELGAKGLPVDRAQLRENFQTGNIQREGFYTPGDISRIAAQQQNNNTSNNTTKPPVIPKPTAEEPTGPRYTGTGTGTGYVADTKPTNNNYVAPEKTTALGGVIPAATQFRMDSAGASGFGKTGESRLVPDVAPSTRGIVAPATPGITWTPNNASVVPDSVIGVPGKTYQTSGNGDPSLTAYSKGKAKRRAELYESDRMVNNLFTTGAAVAGSIGGGILGAPGGPAGIYAGAIEGAGVASGLVSNLTNRLTNWRTNGDYEGDTTLSGAAKVGLQNAAAEAVGIGLGQAAGGLSRTIRGVPDKGLLADRFFNTIKTKIGVAKIEAKISSQEALSELISGEIRRAPFYDATNKAPSSVASPFPTPIKPITGTPWKPVAPTEVVPAAPWRPTETVLDSGLVIPPSGTRTKAAVQGIDAPVISGQSLADSKPVSSIETVLKEDNVKELTPRQVAARAREAKKKLAREALTETTPAAESTIKWSQVEADIEATRRADVAAGINSPPDPTIDDFLRSSKPQSALSQEPIGAAASDPNLASPTALNPSGKVTVADAINQGQAKAAVKPLSEDTVKYLAEQERLAALNKLTPAERLETLGTEPSVKNPNRNKALIRPEGEPLPGMERTGNRFDKAEQDVLNKTGFFDTEIPAPKPRSVFEAKTDVDEAFTRVTDDELGRAWLENKSLGELIKPKLEAVRAENKALFRDRVREYENRRYPNIDDMSGRPIPTPDANKPVDSGLAEAKRVFEETGVAPKRGSDYQLNKKTGEIYRVKRQSGVPLTPEQKLANKTANIAKQNNNKKIGRALNSGKIDVETAKEVLSAKPGTVTLADAIKKGAAKEVGTTELGTFVGKDGSLYTAKTTLPDTIKGPLGATGRQTARARAEIAAPVYPRGLPDNAPLFSPPRTITPALEKAYTTELANQARIFETTGKPTAKEDQVRGLIKNLFGPETLGRIDAEAGTGLRTTIKLPSAVTEPTIGAAVKPKFLPSGKIQGETLDEQIANWTKYSNSEAFKTLSITNPKKYTEVVNANSAINAATKARVDEALAKQSAFKLQQPSSAGKGISSADDPWLKTGNNLPTEFAGGPPKLELDPFTQTPKDPVLAAAREQGLPYGAEINPADPRKFVPKQPSPIPANASKEQQMAFDAANKEYFDELNGVGPEALGREQAAMNLENQTALREQAAAMPNSPLKRETIKELNTFNRINRPGENYPGFGTTSQRRTMGENEFVFGKGPGDDPFQYGRTSPYSSIVPVDRNIKPGDTFESYLKVKGNAGKTEADYAAAMSDYNTRLSALEEQTPRFTGEVEPFVGRFTQEQNQSLEAWSATRPSPEIKATISVDELTGGAPTSKPEPSTNVNEAVAAAKTRLSSKQTVVKPVKQESATDLAKRKANLTWAEQARKSRQAQIAEKTIANEAKLDVSMKVWSKARIDATSREEWMAANEALKGTPAYIGNPYEQTAAMNAIRNENTGDVGTQLKEFDYEEIFKD